jgi:hypothetical protein
MKSFVRLGLAGLMTAALLGGTSTAFANDEDVIKEGPCSFQSDWKIKNSPENNGQIIEIEFEVDQNVVGDTWKVVLKYNGQRVFSGNAVTQAPSGSFEVQRNVTNAPGADTSVGIAKNLSTGEVCKGSVTSNF